MENGRARGRADRWPRRRAAGLAWWAARMSPHQDRGGDGSYAARLIGEIEARHGARIEVLAS